MKNKSLLLFSGLLFFILNAAPAQKYAIYFRDKSGTPYTLDRPSDFLSQRSIDRRWRFGITLTEEDLPVNPHYIEAVEEKGAIILLSSKWLNCVLAEVPDDNILTQIKSLDCVQKTEYIYPLGNKALSSGNSHKKDIGNSSGDFYADNSSFLYGKAAEQIKQINGIAVHQRGYQGEGVLIAVLDAGFANVDKIDAFQHLFDENRVILTRDLVQPENDIYHQNAHGTSVLSCMAAFLPNKMIGTAPKASYCLIRTEDVRTEYPIEEYNWVIGAEIADSLGADILNSSLTYTTFSDPAFNYTYADMDGRTTICAIGAQKLLERGVFICASAGNSGNSDSWPWIGTPADVPGVLTVGAVRDDGYYASFSSIGPNAVNELKPNIMARGSGTVVIEKNGTISAGDGTSYASPIACGMVACLLQVCPEMNPAILKSFIEASSSQYASPDSKMGYGIPDFDKVFRKLPVCRPVLNTHLTIHPNPTFGTIYIRSETSLKKAVLYDVTGRLILEKPLSGFQEKMDLQSLSFGLYILHLYDDKGDIHSLKIVKK